MDATLRVLSYHVLRVHQREAKDQREWKNCRWNTKKMKQDKEWSRQQDKPNGRKKSIFSLFSVSYHLSLYIMVSKDQWKSFWLATQLYPEHDWTGWQNGVNYDVDWLGGTTLSVKVLGTQGLSECTTLELGRQIFCNSKFHLCRPIRNMTC